MKNFLAGLMTAILLPCVVQSSPSAHVRMYCASVKFNTGNGPSNIYKLDFTTSDPNYTPNGELAPLFGDYSYDFWSYFSLDDGPGYDPMTGTININTPPYTDSNDDGFPDFFDVSQSGSGTATGVYTIPGIVPSGTVQVQWTRAAGSRTGTCVLTLQSMGAFTHTFEILEYQGLLNYQPGSNAVSGTMQLTRTGYPAETIVGSLSFTKSSTSRFNSLLLQAGALTNGSAQSFDYFADTFTRDATWNTNYYGWISFTTNSPVTGAESYLDWTLSIDDPNDGDLDRIPDFSDDLARQPIVGLIKGPKTLQMVLSGDIGRSHDLLMSLDLTNWQAVSSFRLTNNPHILTLPITSSEKAQFWRVKTQ